ncbi:hypothetical protein J6590_022783 [Homalodisca vitripennis]|nr:hypothetical protein J6590_022783 [Homalodisca vitripennis]
MHTRHISGDQEQVSKHLTPVGDVIELPITTALPNQEQRMRVVKIQQLFVHPEETLLDKFCRKYHESQCIQNNVRVQNKTRKQPRVDVLSATTSLHRAGQLTGLEVKSYRQVLDGYVHLSVCESEVSPITIRQLGHKSIIPVLHTLGP